MRVIKRDGTIVNFEQQKITNAIQKALDAVKDGTDASNITNDILSVLQTNKYVSRKENVNIEDIQDIVETILMSFGCTEAAKAYILYREERTRLRKKRFKPDITALSDYIHYFKYASFLPDKQRRETYLETSHRCRDMHLRKFCNYNHLPEEYEWWKVQSLADKETIKLYDLIMWAWEFVDKKIVLPSMRSMQFGGKAIEDQNARIFNCSFTLVDRPRVFQEIFYLLLCGCGVGFSVQQYHVSKLPKIKLRDNKKLRHHTIEDSIIDWADSIGVLIDSFFCGYYVEFDYSKIRPQGSLLKISGGKAPGHFPLKHLHIIVTDILSSIINRQLRSIECHDIICHIADSVLSGGIRRSSLISLFSIDDEEMLNAKIPGHFEHYGENGQRALANNSAVLLRHSSIGKGLEDELKKQFLKIMELNKNNLNGEPGFFFTNNLDYGCNPCGEIGLYPKYYPAHCDSNELKDGLSGVAFCNLTEINCAIIKDQNEFYQAAKAATIIGTLQAAYTDMPYLGSITEGIAKRDALLGVSLTGIMDNPSIALDPSIQQHAVKLIKHINEEIAKLIDINVAKRLTTVKPSGTASLLLGGVASGIHPHHSKRYFRRITANKNEAFVKQFINFNPQMVEYKPNGDISLVFPIETPTGGITLDLLSVQEFLKHVFSTYENWIKHGCNIHNEDLTHNISCTVCFKPNEYENMVEQIWRNRNKIASMSFIPWLSDKMIPFMPRESVINEKDEVLWNKLIQEYKPIDYSTIKDTDMISGLTLELACSRDNEECGVVSTIVEDTVELIPHSSFERDFNEAQFKYEKMGTIIDSFGNELIIVRRM